MSDIPFTSKPGIMIDIETLGNTFNAAIVSIGACKFTFDKGVTDTFYVNIDPKSCKEIGLVIDKKTIDWWSQQSKEARLAWQKDPISIHDALTKLSDWWSKKSLVYCNGAAFDFPILKSAYLAAEIQEPWNFHNEMDLRTMFSMIGVSLRDLRANDDGVYHNALDDAIAQTKYLIKAFT